MESGFKKIFLVKSKFKQKRHYTGDRADYIGDCRKSLAYAESFLGKSNSSSIKTSVLIPARRA
jgi:hypothetical protein